MDDINDSINLRGENFGNLPTIRQCLLLCSFIYRSHIIVQAIYLIAGCKYGLEYVL